MADESKSSDSTSGEGASVPHDDVRDVIRRGLKFSEDLIAENERLRFRLASFEASGVGPGQNAEAEQTVAALKERVRELETEKQRLLDSFKKVETLNRDYQNQYAQIEEEHNNLANLYIASYQLHSSLDFREVLQIIAEIVINLVGVHRFGLYLQDRTSGELHAVFAEGQEPADLPMIKIGEGTLGKQVEGGEVVLATSRSAEIQAVVPLALTDHLIGAIVVHELLVQKESFSGVDQELFHLLGAHAATAILTSLIREHAGSDAARTAIEIETVRGLLSGDPS